MRAIRLGGSTLVLAALAIAAAPPPARADAGADRTAGLARLAAKDYDAASVLLGRAYDAAPDDETLFAWAESERLGGRCVHANELYQKLLGDDLVARRRAAVMDGISACDAYLVAHPAVTEPAPATPVPVATEPTPEPERPADDVIVVPVPPPEPRGRPWYDRPIGLALLGGGVAGLGVGVGFYASAIGSDRAADDAPTYGEYADHKATARRLSRIGIASGALGAGLLVGGIVYYALGAGRERPSAVAVHVDAGGGAITWSTGF